MIKRYYYVGESTYVPVPPEPAPFDLECELCGELITQGTPCLRIPGIGFNHTYDCGDINP